MARGVRVVLSGLGPIGQGIARLILETPGLTLVGACDISTEKAGQDLGKVLGLPRRLRVKVESDPLRLARRTRADLAILSTSSGARALKPQVLAFVARGTNVVSTCEELAFPVPAHRTLFRDIDRAAQRKKVSVLATGVNPGYSMDALALMLTAPCARVDRVSVTRVVDASSRRLSLQRKVGAGLNLNQFRRAMTEGTVRHVGLTESAHMIAAGLGWQLERVDETLEPVIAPRDLDTEHLRIAAGASAGIRQSARGYRDGQALVNLDLQVYVGAESPRDHVLVDGLPPIDMTIAGGVSGDVATAAIVVNVIPKLLAARPGLLSMRDIPLVHRLNPFDLKSLPARKR